MSNCPVCRAQGWFIKTQIAKCPACLLEYADPMPDQEELDDFYRDYSDFRANPEIVRANARRNMAHLMQHHGLTKEHTLLDYGCGQNIFVTEGQSANWQGYDPYLTMPVMGSGLLDWITLWGVLEHLAKPVDVMRMLADLLKPGGKMALTTVWLDAPIPLRHKPPEHLTYWSSLSLIKLMEPLGMVIVDSKPYVMVQDADVYLDCCLRTVPTHYRQLIKHNLPARVEVPTNEVFLVAEKT
jgi:SAM-dependent methyltransferase